MNAQSGSICGLICMEREVPCWSETAVEGSSSNSYSKHPPVSPSTPLKAASLMSGTLTLHLWCYKLKIKNILSVIKNTIASIIYIISSVRVLKKITKPSCLFFSRSSQLNLIYINQYHKSQICFTICTEYDTFCPWTVTVDNNK